MSDIKLSICVPTYNGAQTINRCLQSIFEARKGFEDTVEIIVSDNASTDETYRIISSITETNYYVYSNKVNIGYNQNLFKLIDEYSKGEFVWTIGDDDLISKHSIELFMKYSAQMDILLFDNRILSENSSLNSARKLTANKMSYYMAIDRIANGSNILATFMTCAIFRRETINRCDKTNIQVSDWDTYSMVFPNGYLLNEGFSDCENAYCADEIYVYNIPIPRPWAENMVHIQTKMLPEFYLDVCKNENAYKTLRRTRFLIIKALIKITIFYKDFKYKKKAIKSLCGILTCRGK